MGMNRQDQQAAEQLDAYIDAYQQSRPTRKEYPFVDQLLAMSKNIKAKPTVKDRVTYTMTLLKQLRLWRVPERD